MLDKYKYMESRILKEYPNYRIYEDGTVIRMAHKSAKGSFLKEKEIKAHLAKNRYLMLSLHNKKGQMTLFYLHRLVYQAFLGEIPTGFEIDHIDGDRTNCKVQNLRLSTHRANCNNPESVKNYRASNAREKGKYDKERLYEAKNNTTDDMFIRTYMKLAKGEGKLGVMDIIKELHVGFPRARRIMDMASNRTNTA